MKARKLEILVFLLLAGSGCLQSGTKFSEDNSAISVATTPNNLVVFDHVWCHNRPGFLTNSFWNIHVNNFKWSSSPIESISRLENIARSLAHAPAIRFFWPKQITEWRSGVFSLKNKHETGTIANLLLHATQAAQAGSDGLLPVFFDDGVFVTQPRRNIFFKRNLIIKVVDKDSELLLNNVEFFSDTLIPPDYIEFKEGSYLVRVNPQILLHNVFEDWVLINYDELYKTLTLKIQREGYQTAEISIGVVGTIHLDDFFYVPLTPLAIGIETPGE